jgi:hypothetical protein
MYLLYLDESGNENDPADRFFVLAGISLFERQTYFLTQRIEALQERFFPNHPPIPVHASEIRAGRGFWRSVPWETRRTILEDFATALRETEPRGRVLFAAVVEKSGQCWGDDAVARATEEICRRFDLFLQRRYHQDKDRQRGLLIFSEGRFDARAKVWVRDFHRRGTQWGAIRNLADIPYFAATRESRLLQAADFVAHATWLLYERRDPSLFRHIRHCFDQRNGRLDGLVHVRPDGDRAPCPCPACASRRDGESADTWLQDAGEIDSDASPA